MVALQRLEKFSINVVHADAGGAVPAVVQDQNAHAVEVFLKEHSYRDRKHYNEQGFHPDRPAPSKCVGQVGRKF